MKIAILNTSTDTAVFSRNYPDDGQRFVNLLSPLRPEWHFCQFDVKDGQFPDDIDGFQGALITGSPASVHSDLPWIHRLCDLIRIMHADRLPLIGVCFGHQLIAAALGGAVSPNTNGCNIGISLTHFADPLPWMTPVQDNIALYSGNYDQVTVLPQAARRVGTSRACPNAAVMVADHIFTTQFHPEMPRDYLVDLASSLRSEIGAQRFSDVLYAVEQPTDHHVFATWMVQFLEAARRG